MKLPFVGSLVWDGKRDVHYLFAYLQIRFILHCYQLSTIYRVIKQLTGNERHRTPIKSKSENSKGMWSKQCIVFHPITKLSEYTLNLLGHYQGMGAHVGSFSCRTFCDSMGCTARQAPLSVGCSRQEYWSKLPCPPLGKPSQPRDRTHVSYVSCIGRWVLYHQHNLGSRYQKCFIKRREYPCSRAQVPQSLCYSTREATAMRSLYIATREQPPLAATGEGQCAAVKTQHSQKIKKIKEGVKKKFLRGQRGRETGGILNLGIRVFIPGGVMKSQE